MMNGFYGRLLKIDLTNKKYSIVPIKDEIFLKYLGGKGLASYFLYKLNPEGVDPLSPDNCLIFATGLVTGSIIWGSCRYGVFTKSPQTGFYSESYAGGKVPEAIDSTGFDLIVITGKNDRPYVLEIHPKGAVFHDAREIWGLNTFETEDIVNKRFGHKAQDQDKCGSVVIGPAAENLVRFAVIQNNYWRSAGRTGVGTVMGSKKLKAIVFKGDKRRSLFDKEKVIKLSKEIALEAKDSPSVRTYKSWGTPGMVKIINKANAFPTKYWSEGFYDKWPNISAEALHEQCSVEPHACPKCFIACGRRTTVLNGRHAGLKLEGPEYETIYAFGGICMIGCIEEIAYLNDICDRMGMDTITAGNLCGFTIEAARNKKIDFKIDYGDVDAIADLLEKIAKRKDIGDTIARGIIHAAKEWDMEDIAVHVKGLEPPGYDPRVLKGCGLAFATSDRGACHLRATFHNPELTGLIDPEIIQGKAKLFVDFEDRLTLFDALILCRFYRDLYPWKRIGQIINAITGMNGDKTYLQKNAAEISNIVRKFNIREGLKPEDDNLPQSLYKKVLKTGYSIKEKEINVMLNDYYKIRGWNKPYSHSL